MSAITVIFEGMLVLFVNKNRKYCNVGILKEAPHHNAQLVAKEMSQTAVHEITTLEDDEFEPQLWLDVQKANPKITLATDGSPDPFHRVQAAGKFDFRWALDFEGNDMYQHPIAVERSGFSSILQINDGEFFTVKPSDNILKKKKKGSAAEEIGQVATRLGALITLNENDKAELWNGDADDQPIATFTHKPNVDYTLYLAKVRDPSHQTDMVDAENYYSALGHEVAPGRKLHFEVDRDLRIRIDPDARCLIGWMGTTEIQ